MRGGSAQVVQKWWVFMLLFLFPFQVECSSVNNIIIIIMVKDTVSQRYAITCVNNSKDIFATHVRWNVINTPVPAGTLSALSPSCDLYCICQKQQLLWAAECAMVFKVLSLRKDKNFTINFSILNRVSFCSGSLTLCSLWTGLWSSGVGRGKSEKACRQTFGPAVPRYPLCIRSWCKLLLARTLTVDWSDWHRLFVRHVARDLITEWQ